MSAPGRTVTLIIHGTFARDETWWRRGNAGAIEFADRLEAALAAKGLQNTVWDPVLNHGFSYDDFSWSGENRHSQRVKGAKNLCAKLAELAKCMGATIENPLSVNLVSHSHGGNVCLEMLRYLPRTVSINKFVTLGTPLIACKPAARLIRFFAAFMVFLLLLWLPMQIIEASINYYDAQSELRQALPDVNWRHDDVFDITLKEDDVCRADVGMKGKYKGDLSSETIADLEHARQKVVESKCEIKGNFGDIFLIFLVFAPILSLVCNVADWIARPVIYLFRIKNWIRDLLHRVFPRLPAAKSSRKAYGPSDFALKRIVKPGSMLAVTSRLDEAELILQVGTAPARLYEEFRRGIRSRFKRTMEFLFLNGVVNGLILKGTEALFERISLGMPLWRVMWFNYEIDHPENGGDYYLPNYLSVRRLNLQVETSPLSLPMSKQKNINEHSDDGGPLDTDLQLSLKEVLDDLKKQILLRHSSYYKSAEVMDLISDFIVKPSGVE